ncbi:MAG: helix-turn-helix domain-containing protein [Clostridiales bacterium]|jgi:DNA-binding phage protein|nr:helix-turn-helix domain-containing protein [Clostridiales bacterium]
MIIKEFLVSELEKRRRSLSNVARVAGLPSQTVYTYVHGEHPPVDNAEKLLNALGFQITLMPRGERENITIKEFLVNELEKRRRSLSGVARIAGLSPQTVYHYILGKNPPVDNAEKLLNALGFQITLTPRGEQGKNL